MASPDARPNPLGAVASRVGVAWSAADNALQIHGGNGFALEFEISRILCDARILNIFEGAAEIQAQVIARRFSSGLRGSSLALTSTAAVSVAGRLPRPEGVNCPRRFALGANTPWNRVR